MPVLVFPCEKLAPSSLALTCEDQSIRRCFEVPNSQFAFDRNWRVKHFGFCEDPDEFRVTDVSPSCGIDVCQKVLGILC